MVHDYGHNAMRDLDFQVPISTPPFYPDPGQRAGDF
jgi:hypothetical protein